AGRLVGAVFAPHHRENSQFGIAGLPSEERDDLAVLGERELMLGNEFGCDGHREIVPTVDKAANMDSKTARPSVEPISGSQARSGCGIMPMTLRPLFRMPAMSRSDPLGLSR